MTFYIRLEQEEVYADFQKGVEALRKENEMLVKKEKIIDKALQDTEADIQSFQTFSGFRRCGSHLVVETQGNSPGVGVCIALPKVDGQATVIEGSLQRS